jgi:Divergent InlB B-repeat domain
VLTPMPLGRPGYAGQFGRAGPRPWLLIAIVVLVTFGWVGAPVLAAPAAGEGPRGASLSSASGPARTPSVPTPSFTFPPFIESFTATPAYLFAGNVTDLSVIAFDSDVLNYAYSNLPGCSSANTSFLVCDTIFPGTFDIEVTVTDTNASVFPPEYSTATVELTVYPGSPELANQSMFAIDPSAIPNLSPSDAACTSVASPPFYQDYCYPEAADPTLLSLNGGEVGLATELYTNLTSNTCAGAAKATVARIGFSLSSDEGASFGPAVTLGNNSCAYLDAIEPSFASVGAKVFGAFVEENSSTFAAQYVTRPGDAIGFVSSTTNGASFGAVRTIFAGGGVARPVVAARGSTVYVVYEKIANSTKTIGGKVDPIGINFLLSTNGGATFTGPYRVPGLNATDGYNAMSPAIAVNATGTVAIAYATNRTCLAPGTGGACNEYGDSIVVVTSTNHGGTWQGPYVVARGAGETDCYTGACLPGFFESTPQISVAFAPVGSDLYVAYASVYSQGRSNPLTESSPTGVFAAESSDGGTSWSGGPVAAPVGSTLLRSYDPGLAVSASGVYVTYVQANASAGTLGFADSLSQWWDGAPLGPTLAWAPPDAINVDSFAATGGAVNATRSSYSGDVSTIAFGTGGIPLVAFAVPYAPVLTTSNGPGYYYDNTSYATDIAVGSLLANDAPGTVSVVFMQAQLPLGTPWTLTMNGVNYVVTAPAIEFDNLPADAPVVTGAGFSPTFWEVVTSSFPETVQTFFFSETVILPFEVWVGLEFTTFPGGIGPWIAAEFDNQEVMPFVLSSPFPTFVFAEWYVYEQEIFVPPNTFTYIPTSELAYSSPVTGYDDVCEYALCNYTAPWYFPLGSTITLNLTILAYDAPPPVFWTGTGNGSYTGPVVAPYCFDSFDCPASSGNIVMDGPINETLWMGDSPQNLNSTVQITASGLPSTSQFSVSFDSAPYTAPADGSVQIPDVTPGAHYVSNVSATAPTPGWEYFGAPVGPDPFVAPIETGVNLAFTSLVHVGAPAGKVAFHATALATGTTWSITFNGTTYSSSTPWINVTTHPGTYSLTAGDATSGSGTTGYVPTSPSENISVTPGMTYPVGYAAAYRVAALSSTGGLVSVQGETPGSDVSVWETSGTDVHLSATTSPGYSFDGWSGTGPGAYSGTDPTPSFTVSGPVVETASFVPLPGARFNLTLTAEGLPAQTLWTVDLGGTGYSSNGSTLTAGNLWPWGASGNLGHYPFTVPVVYQNSTNLTRFVPISPPTVVGTNGSLTAPIVVDFTPQVYVEASASGGGSVEETYLGAPVGTSDWVPQGSALTIAALADPGYDFSGWVGTGPGSYTGSDANVGLTASGPISEVADFVPVVSTTQQRYAITFDLTTTVAPGTEWSVTFGGQGYSSSSQSLTIPGLALGTYAVQLNTATSPDGLTQYSATATDPAAFTVKGNATVDLAYAASYWISVSAGVGGTVSPGSGWFASGTVLYLVATTNSTYAFSGWTGTGAGNYSGSNATASLIVSGPLTEVANFAPSSSGAAAASLWQNPDTWVGLGAAGLVIGLAVGIVGARLRTRPAGRATPSTSPAPGRGTGDDS